VIQVAMQTTAAQLLGLPGATSRRSAPARGRRRRIAGWRRITRTRHGEIAFLSHGVGRAALLLHGFPLNSFRWRGVMELLAPRRLCIAPDFLGMGQSVAAAGQSLAPEAQVEMLICLLDELGIEAVDIIVSDSAGAVAQRFVARHTQRARSLLLTNCDSEIESPPAAMLPVIELARRGRFVEEWLTPFGRTIRGGHVRRRALGGLCYADLAHRTDDALRAHFAAVVKSQERTRALHECAVTLERNALAGIRPALLASRVPTRVVWGSGDTIFPPGCALPREELRQFARLAPARARKVVLARAAPRHRRGRGAHPVAIDAGMTRGHSSRGWRCARSSASKALLTGRPPPNPVSEPSAPITRWHGMKMGIGLLPFARPTARDAFAFPSTAASAP
jgi:haloalkane dehalogenase